MPAIDTIIETGVDKLVKLIQQKQKISIPDAAKELGVSLTVIEEWADFLEEEGIISIEFKFTKPFLTIRGLTKKQIKEKSKEFSGKKENFIRKAEGTLTFLENEEKKLKDVKDKFDELKGDFSTEIQEMKKDISELERYNNIRLNLNKEIQDQKNESQQKINDMSIRILEEHKKYNNVISNIKRESTRLDIEEKTATSLKESERILNQRLSKLNSMVNTIEKKIKNENLAIENSNEHINK